MDKIKVASLFVLKAFVFSVIFFCTVLGMYAMSSLNSSKKHDSDKSSLMNMEEYNRQLQESSKVIEQQKALPKRADANLREEEKNTKRMSAVLNIWERQARQGK